MASALVFLVFWLACTLVCLVIRASAEEERFVRDGPGDADPVRVKGRSLLIGALSAAALTQALAVLTS
jgi:hypothetical protein